MHENKLGVKANFGRHHIATHLASDFDLPYEKVQLFLGHTLKTKTSLLSETCLNDNLTLIQKHIETIINNDGWKAIKGIGKPRKPSKELQVKREVKKQVDIIRKKKKATKKKEVEKPKPKANFKIGDRVRLEDGRAVGSIDKIEKNKAVVNYGIFTTNVSLEQLELVEASK